MTLLEGTVLCLLLALLYYKIRSKMNASTRQVQVSTQQSQSLMQVQEKKSPEEQPIKQQSPTISEKVVRKRRSKKKNVAINQQMDNVLNRDIPKQERPITIQQKPLIEGSNLLVPSSSAEQMIRQQRLEEISNEILMIESVFSKQFNQLIPHSIRMIGCYSITLLNQQRKIKITLQWGYNIESVRQQAIILITELDCPQPTKQQLLNLVEVTNNKVRVPSEGFPVFELLMGIYELLCIPDEQDLNSPSKYLREGIDHTNELKERTSLNMGGHELSIAESLNNTRKREQHNQLIDQIYFLPGDWREQPNFDDEYSKMLSRGTLRKPNEKSRYKSQFDQIKKLGQGGFGSVFLAKNLLDYNQNAVKKIRLNVADPYSKKVKKEVILLSSLNHPNIVRYYQSWIEEVYDLEQLCADLGIDDSQQRYQIQDQYKHYLNKSQDGEIQIGSKQVSQSQCDQDLGLSAISNQHSHYNHGQSKNSLIDEEQIIQKKQHKEQSHSSGTRNKRFPFQIMYIAMEYCDGDTLKDLIAQQFEGRKHDDNVEQVKIRILRGILQALVYLHDKKIVHRDLKPANIFLDKKKQRVKLGDFGLATNIQDGLVQKGVVGTIRYKAPEQGQEGRYTEKVDMYSLGIIIFELFYCRKYNTQYEKEISFKSLKQQKLPTDFELYCRNPDIRDLLKDLVSRDPNQRPSARQLLSKVKNKLFVQLVSAITNPNHFEFRSLLNSLFQIKNAVAQTIHRDSYRRYNFADIENLFKCHGGNNIHVSPLIPVQDYVLLNKRKVFIPREKKLLTLSQEGSVLEMSSSSYQPWLRWIKDYLVKNIKNKPRSIRRYNFTQIYQQDDTEESNIHRQKIVGVFDVVVDLNRQYLAKHQCEMIKLSAQASYEKDCVVHISHSLLLKILSEELKLSQQSLYRVVLCRHFQKTIEPQPDKWEQAFRQNSIQDNVSRRFLKFFKLRADNPKDFIQLLKSQELNSNFSEVLKQLETVHSLLQLMKITQVVYRVMIPFESCFGVFWKVTKTPEQNKSCVSGFTALEEYYRNEEMGCMHVELELSTAPKPLVDVYVWSVGQGLQKEMVQIVNDCWDNGIYADWSYESLGQKVEGVRLGLILKRILRKLSVGVRKFDSIHNNKIQWYARENFSMEMLKTILQQK